MNNLTFGSGPYDYNIKLNKLKYKVKYAIILDSLTKIFKKQYKYTSAYGFVKIIEGLRFQITCFVFYSLFKL